MALFIIVLLVAAIGNMSQTAINAMLVHISADLGIEVSLGQLFTTVYMLVMGISVFVVGFMSRKLGMRAATYLCLALFLAGSVIDIFAFDFWTIMIGRVLQGFSAGVTVTLMQTIVMTHFPSNRQATAMGFAGIAMGFSPNVGPVISGFMVDVTGWRGFFVLLAAISAVLFAAGIALVRKEGTRDTAAKLDMVSLVLVIIGFGGLLLGLSNAAHAMVTDPAVWLVLFVGVVFTIVFLNRQKKMADPMVSLGVFNSKRYVHSSFVLCFLMASFMGVTLVVPLWWINVCGGTAFEAGIILLPGTIAALIFNPLAGILTDKIGVRPVVVFGSACLALGACGMVFLGANTPLAVAFGWQAVRQIGVSCLIGPLSTWGYSGVPGRDMNSATSFGMATRQTCGAFGTACMVMVATLVSTYDPELAYHLAFGVSAFFAVLAFIWSLLFVHAKHES